MEREAVVVALRRLERDHPLKLQELWRAAHAPEHRIASDSLALLQLRRLVDEEGRIRPLVRQVVLEAVCGEDLALKVRNGHSAGQQEKGVAHGPPEPAAG